MNEQQPLPGFGPQVNCWPTEWRDDIPNVTGWYRTCRMGTQTRYEERRFFNGKWSEPVLVGLDDDDEATLCAGFPASEQLGIQWQGLDAPHPNGYSYALVLIGPFMTCSLADALDRLP